MEAAAPKRLCPKRMNEQEDKTVERCRVELFVPLQHKYDQELAVARRRNIELEGEVARLKSQVQQAELRALCHSARR